MADGMMRAVYLHAVRDMRLCEEPIPKLTRPEEALVRIIAVGICGSDCHFYERGRIGHFVLNEPVILGHECAGVVVEVGAEVNHLKPGDHVAIEPGYPCRKCSRCREGRYNLCEREVAFMATPGLLQGAFRDYLTWPADFLFKLPETASFEDGAMVEPLAVGIHACRRGGITPGACVAVIGGGPIGLLAAQAARAYGAFPVIVTDVIAPRLERARAMGFITVNATEEDPIGAIRATTEGKGPDVVIETAGSSATIRQAMTAVKTGGIVVLVGLPPEDEATLPLMDMIQREYDLHTVFRYANCYPIALQMIAAGRVDLAPLRTHAFPLERAEDAIRMVIEHKAEAMKVMVKV